jgi:hypothetical protein
MRVAASAIGKRSLATSGWFVLKIFRVAVQKLPSLGKEGWEQSLLLQ